MKALFLATLWLLPPASSPANEIAKCEAYKQVSRQLGCPDSNYLTSYGYRYCRAFVEAEGEFSPGGRVVLAGIRACLIDSLLEREDLTCKNVSAIAENDHLRCYTRNGWCSISPADKMIVLKLIWPELTRSFQTWKTAQRIEQACSEPARAKAVISSLCPEPDSP